ncbi:hypothetical protein OWR29_39600 [Actinoplanes sp. Pm04-4]|uniref:Alpha/beta hydrolase n=1 Tax=Paractinoplanes pyxinae TaxID=2997416 RepID=A0ABT4BCC4_9ACTN|nr:hypothetical protein [Actinoplanes pyxinae]MCY1144137.1 hypothetical protein [Actinoplanes pyxinae]
MASHVVLLPSPFLGSVVWESVADVLRGVYSCAVTVPVPPDPAAADPAVVLASFEAQLPDGELILVAHSNAGLYVPAMAVRRPVRGVVFVDAVLPPARGEMSVAPVGLRESLRDLVGADGKLPPWTTWWPEDEVARLFPDDRLRALVTAEQRQVPFAYLAARIEVPAGWDDMPAAYLSFGDTYADERADAVARGWPVSVMVGGHLHMLHAPAAVAAEVMRLVPGGA